MDRGDTRLNLALDNILDVVPFIDNTGEADAPLNFGSTQEIWQHSTMAYKQDREYYVCLKDISFVIYPTNKVINTFMLFFSVCND